MKKVCFLIILNHEGFTDNLPPTRAERRAEFNRRATNVLAEGRKNIDAFLKANNVAEDDFKYGAEIKMAPTLIVECSKKIADMIKAAGLPGIKDVIIDLPEIVALEKKPSAGK